MGRNQVAPKAVTFGYDTAGEFSTINRYNDLSASQLVATSTYGFDGDGNLTSLAYTKSGSALPSYSWTYAPLGNMATAYNNTDGSATYTSDSTGQLGSAAYTDSQGNESYTYDSNGNRTNTGDIIGPNNELLYDGTYRYQYDADGNLIARWQQSNEHFNAGLTAPASGDS